MDTIKNIKLFIGSPSDTTEERNCVPAIINELNQTFGKNHGVHIDSVTWEYDVQPTVGTDGQDVINQQVEGYDVFVGMMWKKYGFPTLRANSATDEEYTHAIKSFKEGGHCRDVIMLFCNKPVPVDVDASQLQLVQDFKKRVAKDGVYYKTYSNIDEFCSILRIALYNRLSNLLKKENSEKQKNNIKKITPPQVAPLDDNTKLVFDTLANSPTINDMKLKFIESYILLYLFEKKLATANEIIDYLEQKLGEGKKVLYNNVLSKLNNTGCLGSDNSTPKQFSLSEKKMKEIARFKQEAETSTYNLISGCKKVCEKYDIDVAPEELNQFVCRLFEVSFSTETREWTRIARKNEETLKSVYVDLVSYLQSATSLPASYVTPVANQLVDLYSKNPMVYKSNTSRMFLSLYQNDRLDEYLDNNHRDLVLDTQILLQVCCVSFDGMEPIGADVLYKVGRRFWKSATENRTVRLHTTVDYITEVASHLFVAHRLSRFLDLDYIKDLGPSKNVFFNHYLLCKDANDYESFDDYLCDLLDIDYSEIEDATLTDTAYKRFLSVYEDLGIEVTSIPEVAEYAKYKKEYDMTMDLNGYQSRSYNARQADLHAALYVGNLFGDFETTPYFVTTDTSLAIIRDRLSSKFVDIDYWYVYSPQKMTEALQLSQFKIDPEMVDENIISLTESNFNTSNDTISFIDLLNTFVDKKQLTEWRLASKLSKIRRIKYSKVYDNVLQTENQPIDEFLALLTEFYQARRDGYKFSELKDLFTDNDAADEIANYIQQQIESFKIGSNTLDSKTFNYFDSLILAKIKKDARVEE